MSPQMATWNKRVASCSYCLAVIPILLFFGVLLVGVIWLLTR